MSKELKEKIKQKVIAQYRVSDNIDLNYLKKEIVQISEDIIKREHINLSAEEKKKALSEIIDELFGLGLIEDLLKDSLVTEIMINGPEKVYAERSGIMGLTGIVFENDAHVMCLINKMLMSTRRHVDESFPYTEIRLSDGSRVNIIIPPLSLNGPTITIRKFLKTIKQIDDLIRLSTLDQRMADFLVASIKGKINIIFSGSTGAGKTTTLNVLSSYIPDDERIVTIEDTAELLLTQDHVVRLESRHPNIEGKGEVTIRNLFKNSLRMRPDRIILGEIRSAEALDMLQAICSGHKGSLSVIHANSPQDVVYRLETMILTSGVPINLEAIHRQIAASVNLIVQQEQLLDGSRKITHISQVNGLKNNQAVLEDIFVYDLEGIDRDGKVKGKWKATGVKPFFFPLLKKLGIELSGEIFKE